MANTLVDKAHCTVRRSTAAAHSALTLFVMSLLLRFAGYRGAWAEPNSALLHLIVPLVFAVLFALCVFVFGRKLFRVSSLPFIVLAVVCTIEAADGSAWWHIVLYVAVCLAAAAVYACTAFGLLHTRWIMVGSFTLMLLLRFSLNDLGALRTAADTATLSDGLRELTLLCTLASTVLIGLSLEITLPEKESELPKIKTPVVIRPEVQEGEFVDLVTVLDESEDSRELTELHSTDGQS